MTKVILFNGPPRVGKDTAGAAVLRHFNNRRVAKFATEVKDGTHRAYGMAGIPTDHFEAVKEEPRPEFLGATPRAAYIAFSETFMKPLHGQDVFGRLLLQSIKHAPEEVIAVTDCGFEAEVNPIIDHFQPENVLLVRLMRRVPDTDKFYSFKGDSRNYLNIPRLRQEVIVNEYLTNFEQDVIGVVRDFIRQP